MRMDLPWGRMVLPASHQIEFDTDLLWSSSTIADLARSRAQSAPDAIALIDNVAPMSFGELWNDACALAAGMMSRGLVAGDVVAFQLPNWREAAVLNVAAVLCGLVINPIVPIYRDAEIRQMLSDCRAKALFVPGVFRNVDYVAMAARVRGDVPDLAHIFTVRGHGEADYTALIAKGRGLPVPEVAVDHRSVKMVLYTSGTTGKPKGVLHSHATLHRVIAQSSAYWGLAEGERMLMPSPVTHISGYANGLEMPLVSGSCTILMESWNAAEALELVMRHGVVGTVAATPFLVELATTARTAGERLPSLRFFACGGAAVAPDVIMEARAAFAHCAPFRVFGSSEVPLVTFGWPDRPDLAATTDGRIVDYAVRIVDEEGRDLSDGREGEILARGPAMMIGYTNPDQTTEAIDSQGYFRTGDLGIRDGFGALTITGRKKDLIIRGGENISATEIEIALLSHPAVTDVAVVAMPHPRLGEGVCAYIVSNAPVDGAMLAAHIAASGMAKQKIPERFEVVDHLPRTASGKIRKDVLRGHIAEKLAAEDCLPRR